MVLDNIMRRQKLASLVFTSMIEDEKSDLSKDISKNELELINNYAELLGLNKYDVEYALENGKTFREETHIPYKNHLSPEEINKLFKIAYEDGIIDPEEKNLLKYMVLVLEGYKDVKSFFKEIGDLTEVSLMLSSEDPLSGYIKEKLNNSYIVYEGSIFNGDKDNIRTIIPRSDVLIIDPRIYFEHIIDIEKPTEEDIENISILRSVDFGNFLSNVTNNPIILYTQYGEINPSAWGLNEEENLVIRKQIISSDPFGPEIKEENKNIINLERAVDGIMFNLKSLREISNGN